MAEMRGVGRGFTIHIHTEIHIPPGAVLYVDRRENGRAYFHVGIFEVEGDQVLTALRSEGRKPLRLECDESTIEQCTMLNT